MYDYGVNRETLRQKYDRYFELVQGLYSSPGAGEGVKKVTDANKLGPIGATDGNKSLIDKLNDKVGVLKVNAHKQCSVSLRHVFPFRWTDSLSIKPFNDPSLDRVDARVLSCYALQCKAETLEVTIARGIALEHKENLIASLSNDAQILYQEAYDSLKNTYENNKIDTPLKWMKYFELKQKFYYAMSRAYWGLSLLEDQEKSGEAIAHLKQAKGSLANTKD